MPEPAIKNWRNFPPPGGWGVEYRLEGQAWSFMGSPKKLVEQIRKVQEVNGVYVSDEAIWLFLNTIWCERAPDKCIRSMLKNGSRAPVARGVSGPLAKRGAPAGGKCGGCGGGSAR